MSFELQDVPADMADDVETWREKLIETAVEQDDEVMEKYLEGEEPDMETLKRCIRKGTIDLAFFPTFCGSAFKNKGVQLVLDAVVDYLPDPTEVNRPGSILARSAVRRASAPIRSTACSARGARSIDSHATPTDRGVSSQNNGR